MRYARVFLLHFQDALDDKARMFVWFLISLINPLILLLFWKGASVTSSVDAGWQLSDITLYYLLMVIANTFLSVHIEENIAYIDIQEGYLANYLVKPVSYIAYKFFHELSYRLFESVFGVVFLIVLFAALRFAITLPHDAVAVAMVGAVFLLAYCMSFLFKMILGLTAVWTTDFSGLSQIIGVVILITGGFIMPIRLFPDQLQRIIYALPFPYMFYFPVATILGYYSQREVLRIIGIQAIWIAVLYFFYRLVWRNGVKQFTAVGR